MENQEALKTCVLVSQFPNSVQDEVKDFLANSAVSAGIVISSILLACDKLLPVEEWEVVTGANFIMTLSFRSTNTALGTCLPVPY